MVILTFCWRRSCAFVPFTDDTTLIIVAVRGVALRHQRGDLAQRDPGNRPGPPRPRCRQGDQPRIFAGNICGLLAPIVTGYIIAGLGAYDWALWIAGIMLLIGAIAVATMTRK